LVGLPHAGGAASFFAPWRGLLPAGWRLFAAKYPGREDRIEQRRVSTLGEIVEGVLGEFTGAPEAPGAGGRGVVLFGHSMGAVVAFELALRLAGTGRPPVLLGVSGKSPADEVGFFDPADGAGAVGSGLAERVLRLDPLFAEVEKVPELRDHSLDVIGQDLDLLRAHRMSPGVLAGVPILAVGGTEDPSCGAGDLDAWRARTTGPLARLDLPGGHFYIREHVPEVVAAIVAAVAEG
ncbi:MAG: alpha/beta fold hydrolase, partial [Bifidobacteriaceae bacterium]|nr:alpha/beta fold hydrolase [Bifidobacteriaceae bacterium]